ncbi:MAG TPA: hypothetical protein VLA04_02370 [Verrucomicrobiae bacterium]|nr:hypothetical protein [Verrucomicrobiae bacterium]
MRKILFIFVLLTLASSSVLAQVSLTGVPAGVGQTQELQDANASLIGNMRLPDSTIQMPLMMDGRDELIPRVVGGNLEFDLVVNAPRAIDKKTGKPKYKAVYRVGLGEPRWAEWEGDNHWSANVPLEELAAGGYHIQFGLDGLVVGRGRPHIDLLFLRIPLPGKDIKEDRGIVGKLVLLAYRGAPTSAAVSQFLARRAQEYPLTRRVSWVDEMDDLEYMKRLADQRAAEEEARRVEEENKRRGPGPGGNTPPPSLFECPIDPVEKTFTVKNISKDQELEVLLESPDIEKIEPRLLKPGEFKRYKLKNVSNRDALVFTIRNRKTGEILGRRMYVESEK